MSLKVYCLLYSLGHLSPVSKRVAVVHTATKESLRLNNILVKTSQRIGPTGRCPTVVRLVARNHTRRPREERENNLGRLFASTAAVLLLLWCATKNTRRRSSSCAAVVTGIVYCCIGDTLFTRHTHIDSAAVD